MKIHTYIHQPPVTEEGRRGLMPFSRGHWTGGRVDPGQIPSPSQSNTETYIITGYLFGQNIVAMSKTQKYPVEKNNSNNLHLC